MKDLYYRSYGDVLEISDNDQITEHLEHVNQNGELTSLVVGVVNFWVDNAEDLENARNADLALRKLATILDNIEVEQIEEIIEALHGHDIADQLTKLLERDIGRLLGIYHARHDEKTLVKMCFLMNFLDQKTLLRVLGTLDAEDLQAILDNVKAKKLFDKVLSKFKRMRGNLAELFDKFSGFMNMSLSYEPEVDLEFLPLGPDVCLDPGDEFLRMIIDNKISLHDINLISSTKPYLMLQLVNHYDKLPVDMKEAFKSYVVPVLLESPLGKVFIERISRSDPALLHLVSKAETVEQAETLLNQYSYNLSGSDLGAKDRVTFKGAMEQLDADFAKHLKRNNLDKSDMFSDGSLHKDGSASPDSKEKEGKESGTPNNGKGIPLQDDMMVALKAAQLAAMKQVVDRVIHGAPKREEDKKRGVTVLDAKEAAGAPLTPRNKTEEHDKSRS